MYRVETEQEVDGRWIAEVPELPGVLAYGNTHEEAVRKARALSLHVLAERLENSEPLPQIEFMFWLRRSALGILCLFAANLDWSCT